MTAPTEMALMFNCAGRQLVGVASLPSSPAPVGVIVVVGGPQYRAGSHRQFVLLARSLAAAGHAVLRFDYRGMGDSEGEPRSFEQVEEDIGAAIDALRQAAPAVTSLVLWGLCDGASAALLYLDARGGDDRVVGLCLLNPWVRSAATLARTHLSHYYLRRFRQREFWGKLFRGGVGGRALADLGRNVKLVLSGPWKGRGSGSKQLPFTERMARAWAAFPGDIQLILSHEDYTAMEFSQTYSTDPAWRLAHRHPRVERVELAQADHTLSRAQVRLEMEARCLAWLQRFDSTKPGSMAGAKGA